MVALVDKALDSLERGTRMKPEEMFEVFGDFDPGAHEAEAKARWGESASYAESTRRTKRYTKEDWKAIRDEAEAIGRAFGDALASGKAPADLQVMDVAELARLHIDRWFYPCSRDMHRALGQIYVDDPRFAANYEKIRAGLAAFVRDAIRANSARA
jgi:MerR family transcriptional regulator, thiopeptide resistance regulator